MRTASNRLTMTILSHRAVLVVIFIALAGCASEFREDLIGQSPVNGPTTGQPIISQQAPAWVTGDPQKSDTDIFFVGRSVGYNVLDEAAAVCAAREDIMAQVAQLVSTRVMSSAESGDARGNGETRFPQDRQSVRLKWQDDNSGIRTLPGPELRQFIEREAHQFSNAIAGDMLERGVYFEKWDVREQPARSWGRPSRGMIRYKCWLLMSIPRPKLERSVDEFRTLARDGYARFQKTWEAELRWAEENRARSLAWAEQDRQIRIKREDLDRQWAHEMIMADREEAEGLRLRVAKAQQGTLYRVSSTR